MAAGTYDAVVVGSGFGGAVAAHRLARAGLRVCVLERGRPWPPGSFPRTPRQWTQGFWEPAEDRFGLVELWRFGGLAAVTASGLGGGSLLYANVHLRKPASTFAGWPIGLTDLEPHYAAVEAVQRPEPFPGTTPKTAAMEEALAAIGIAPERPPLSVRFGARPGDPIAEDRPNLHDVPRSTCRLVGECDIGCQFGAKQTTDLTFLSEAADDLDIRTLAEVRTVAPEGDGYVVGVVHHDGRAPEELRARRVVLAAGALGTTRLLLGQRLRLPRMRHGELGRRISCNGDLLAFARGTRERPGGPWRYLDPSTGPVITVSGHVPAERSGSGRDLWLQDGGGPAQMEWATNLAGVPSALWQFRDELLRIVVDRLRGRPDPNLGDEAAELIGDAHASAAALGVLAMGMDRAGGRMRLDADRVVLDWDQDASADHFDAVRELVARLAGHLHADPVELPGARSITVHPVGGCAMTRDEDGGVIAAEDGHVLGHPGLHVADGAAMPGPVGPNPSATIAAWAHRVADRIAREDAP